jgi:hypothetical protein
LRHITAEKETLQDDLKEAQEDLGDEKYLVEQQLRTTRILQSRFDELVALVGDKVDAAVVAEIRNRSRAEGR